MGFLLLAVLLGSSTMTSILIKAKEERHFLDVTLLFLLLLSPPSSDLGEQQKHKGAIHCLNVFWLLRRGSKQDTSHRPLRLPERLKGS